MQDRTRANARSDCGRPFPCPLADLTSLDDYEVIISSYLRGKNHQNVKQIQTTLLMDESFWGKLNQTLMTADAGKARIHINIHNPHNNRVKTK